MKKLFLFTISCVLLFSCAQDIHKLSDREQSHLKGNVKSVTEVTYKVSTKFGLENKEKYCSEYTEYDIEGNYVLTQTRYEEGRVFRESHFSDSLILNYYDSALVSIWRIEKVGEDFIKMRISYPGGKAEESIDFKLDKYGRVIERIEYDANESIIARDEYVYKGNDIVKHITYHEDCHSTMESSYNNGIRTDKFTSTCGGDDEPIISKSNKEGDGIDRDVRYVYEYDSVGNWIRKEYYKENELKTIYEREITYF